jgi:hypothetical protein
MRSAPQRGLSRAMLWMSSTVPAATRGVTALGWHDFQRQKRRNPCRCQRSTVSGWTRRTVLCQWRTRLARRTMSPRSCALKLGRATDRAATTSCWSRSAFSASSSSRDRNASSTSPTNSDVGRVATRMPECPRRTTPATTPPAHRANTASTRGIVAIPGNRSSLVRRAFPHDHEADASGSHHRRGFAPTTLTPGPNVISARGIRGM